VRVYGRKKRDVVVMTDNIIERERVFGCKASKEISNIVLMQNLLVRLDV
jgi:hypothetical protein